MTTRYSLKCKAHGITVHTFEGLNRYWDANPRKYGYGPCRECDRPGVVKMIDAKKGTRACGAWCTEGIGRSCTCECEGRNHGATFAHTGALFQGR